MVGRRMLVGGLLLGTLALPACSGNNADGGLWPSGLRGVRVSERGAAASRQGKKAKGKQDNGKHKGKARGKGKSHR